jgi:single-strand DNA-binding protein
MNTINLIGRLTVEPELRYTHNGTPVTTLRLAVQRRPRAGQDQAAFFIDVDAWAGSAEVVVHHLAKGRQVAVIGCLEYDMWETDQGTRSKHKVVADDIQFLAAPASTPTTDEEAVA